MKHRCLVLSNFMENSIRLNRVNIYHSFDGEVELAYLNLKEVLAVEIGLRLNH